MDKFEYEPWNIENEYSPDKYIKKGNYFNYNAAFRKMTDVLECFGIYYKAFQQGVCNHPTDKDILIWFPKMYARKEWINVINENEDIIYEMNENEEKNRDYIDIWINTKRKKRYVFVYTKDSLGMVLYRFKGIFELDENATKKENKAVWIRTGDTVETIENIIKGNK